MATTYLGKEFVNIENTEFANYTEKDWILLFIEQYGSIDGSHHKAWLLDQIARIALGNKISIKKAKWSNGQEEFRFNLEDPTPEYVEWVKRLKEGEDGPNTYAYDEGIAP